MELETGKWVATDCGSPLILRHFPGAKIVNSSGMGGPSLLFLASWNADLWPLILMPWQLLEFTLHGLSCNPAAASAAQ